MSKLRLCGTLRDLDGIQGFTSNEDGDELELNYIGQDFNCDDWDVPEDAWVAHVLIRYNGAGLTFLKASTAAGVTFERGNPTDSDDSFEIEFDRYEPLAGFVGYELEGITAIGFYRYMCAERPEDLNSYDEDGNLIVPEDEGEGEGEEEGEAIDLSLIHI